VRGDTRAWIHRVQTQQPTGGAVRRFAAKNLQAVLLVARWEMIDRVQLHAQALTYDTLLAIVPLMAVAFAAVAGFGGLDDVRDRLINAVIANVSGSSEVQGAVVDYLHRFLANVRTSSFSAVSVVLLIWSVMSLLGHIESSFNIIFGVKARRPLLARLLVYWATLTLGPLLLAASFGLTAALQSSAAAEVMHALGLGAGLVMFVPIIVTWVAFLALYKVVPMTRVDLSAALYAAVVGGSLWSAAKYLYAIYAKHAITLQNIYGSLATVPLFIFWLYVSWLIVLFGAQLAFAYQHATTYYKEAFGDEPSQTYRERVACRLFFEVARDFFLARPPTDPDRAATELAIPRRMLEGVVTDLGAGAFVRKVDGNGLVPATDLAHVSVADIVGFLRSGKGAQLGIKDDDAMAQLDRALEGEELARTARAASATFRDLVVQLEPSAVAASPASSTHERAASPHERAG